jgi:hypothetical protein
VVRGTVYTGDLNADWDCAWTNDDGASGVPGTVQGPHGCPTTILEPSGDNGVDPRSVDANGNSIWGTQYDGPPKDVGECYVRIGNDTLNEHGAQVAWVWLYNAYPSYECTITLQLTNTGSIPFNFIAGVLRLPTANAPLRGFCNSDGDRQVDPNQEKPIRCTIHVEQSAAQNTCTGATTGTVPGTSIPRVNGENCTTTANYQFALDVCVAQWNEDPSPGDVEADFAACKAAVGGTHEGPDASTFPLPTFPDSPRP